MPAPPPRSGGDCFVPCWDSHGFPQVPRRRRRTLSESRPCLGPAPGAARNSMRHPRLGDEGLLRPPLRPVPKPKPSSGRRTTGAPAKLDATHPGTDKRHLRVSKICHAVLKIHLNSAAASPCGCTGAPSTLLNTLLHSSGGSSCMLCNPGAPLPAAGQVVGSRRAHALGVASPGQRVSPAPLQYP